LVEVLIVASALSSMGSGSFEGAKDKARQTKCLQNLQQIGTALQMFLIDNDGRLPPAAFFPTPESKKRGLKGINEVLASYAGSKDLFLCPAAPDAVNKLGISYIWNDRGNNFLVDQVPSPSTTWIMTDISAATTIIDQKVADAKKIDLTVIPPAHVGGYNVLYLDGHVKWSKEPPKIEVDQARRR